MQKKDTLEMARIKTVKELHVQKPDAFFTQMKASRALAKPYPHDTIVICFDYQKIYPFPSPIPEKNIICVNCGCTI